MPEFSPSQQEVIDLRDCNILVSAAAGSGKTTVLVERIIRKILDPVNPVDIDQMLVLTFTKAAAGEMRERIAQAIGDELVRQPENEHLQRQAVLIYNAQITTIDSFCLSVLKNNFTDIGLEPGFRLASEAEMTFLSDEVLDRTVEEILERRDIEHIEDFLLRFESKDSVKKIKESVKNHYAVAQNAPFVVDYLENHRYDYDAESVDKLKTIDWFVANLNEADRDIEDALSMARKLKLQLTDEGPEEYQDVVDSDIELIERLASCSDYDYRRGIFSDGISWKRLPTKTSCDEDAKARAKALRDRYKNIITGVSEKKYAEDLAQVVAQMAEMSKVLHALTDITLLYHNNLESEKRSRGLITFADMEHMALQILLKKENGDYVPTDAAKDYRKCFKELMIDEYQDSNYIQEALIHSISGEDDGRYDRFMVGDIKQSIYRFRNANPELFSKKYEEYTKGSGNRRRVDLSMNYRSRKSVIDATNVVFERIMDKDIGGVAYDEDSRLYFGASYYCEPEVDTGAELLLASSTAEDTCKPVELESLLIAQRIGELISDYKVQDKATGAMRPCTYKDIVVLVRSGGDITENLKRTLEERGIPAYVTSKSGYFSASEIVTLLGFLSVINNPYGDIAMFGVLTSIFGGFTADEVAMLKFVQASSLYESLSVVADSDIDTLLEANPKLAAMNDNACDAVLGVKDKSAKIKTRINYYRQLVPYTPIHELLRKIVSDTDYISYISALPMGVQRCANVEMLLAKAEGFEEDGFKGLFNFNRYIERLHKYESDEGEVVTLDEHADVVRIMTMHKSKGLEFPVCILANLSKGFNHMDERSDVIYHNRYGMGMDYIDATRRIKAKDLRKRFIASMIHRDSLSEEMRILYVAMTRAKEKLIMTAVSDKAEELLEAAAEKVSEVRPYADRIKYGSYLDMLLGARGDDDWNGQCKVKLYKEADVLDSAAGEIVDLFAGKADLLEKIAESGIGGSEDVQALSSRIGYEYEHKNLSGLYTKTSVSELKMAAIHEGLLKGNMEEIPDEFFKTHEVEGYVPKFARDVNEEPKGTTRGSAYHRVMEIIDFNSEHDYVTQMKDKVSEGKISEEELALVDEKKITLFLQSDLGHRMARASAEGELYIEQPFVLGVAANRLSEDFPGEEKVLIQGIIDAFFVEQGEIVLMDYKTDSVKNSEELVERYKTQLDYYTEALERILGMRVKERLIYSFALAQTIEV